MERVAIVTGGTGALGRFVVEKLSAEGIKVYVPSKTLEEFNTVFDTSLKDDQKDFKVRRLFSFECDATDENSVIDFVNNVSVQEKGKIQYLVNTVGGIDAACKIADLTSEALNKMVDLNFNSTFYFTREVLKVMRENKFGRIISVGSMAGLIPSPKRFAYSFTKAAVMNLMDTVSEEMKDLDIRCNTIIPSTIDTPANREWGKPEDFKKWVKPEEIAEIIYQFLSVEFSAVRGSHIKAYGSI